MSDETKLREVLTKLSPEDRRRYDFDMMAYGNAAIRESEDGSVAYLPMKDWPCQFRKTVRKP